VKSLNEKLDNSLTSFGGKSLEKDLKEMEKIFRSTTPFFRYILTSRQQTKQKEALADLQVKLKEMNQIAIDLIASNEFKPSFSIDRDLFGLLHSNRDANSDLFKSQILAGNQALDLMKLCEFNPQDKWTLLYRGTRDGFGAKDFHSKCDYHCNTLTILKAKESLFLFGGFATVSWESQDNWPKNKSDPNAFIFSLTNKVKQPRKIKTSNRKYSISCYSQAGPIFGGNFVGHFDIYIADNADTSTKSFSNMNFTNKLRRHSYEKKTFLAGSEYFLLDEIEVYQRKLHFYQ